MRMASREIPQIPFGYIIDEDGPVRVQECNSSIPVQHDGPFVRSVPMQFAEAAGCEAHVHASDVFGRRQFALRDLMSPATFLNSLMCQVKRIPDRSHISVVGGRGRVRIRILIKQRYVLRAWIVSG